MLPYLLQVPLLPLVLLLPFYTEDVQTTPVWAPLRDDDSYASILLTLTQIASSGRTSSVYCINSLQPNDPYMG
jgi:hypothetical protein